MSAFALIYSGVIIQIDPATFPVAAPLIWTSDISAVSPAPQVGWTATETAGAWSFAAPVVAAQTLPQQATAAMSAGLTITSSTLGLTAALFDVSGSTMDQINLEINAILLNATFADGSAAVVWPDLSGVPHTFTIAQFKTFASTVGAYVAALYKVVNGMLATLPVASVTIS